MVVVLGVVLCCRVPDRLLEGRDRYSRIKDGPWILHVK